MEIPQDDFVSVSINATQLNIFIEDMFKLLKVQDKRMNELSEQFNNVTGSLAMRLRKQEEIFEDERQRQTQLEAQNHNYLNLSLLDAEKRTEQRLQIIEDNILTL